MLKTSLAVLLALVGMPALVLVPPSSGQAGPAEAVIEKLSSPRAVASNPQAAPFVATGEGEIRHVVPVNVSDLLVKTQAPEGLAFDADSNLYVADSARRAILKVRPWGEVSVFADRCGSAALVRPVRVAVGPGSNIYFADSGAARICRAAAAGAASVVAADLDARGGLAFDFASGRLFAADGAGKIWKLSPDGKERALFATLSGQGRASGIAIDDAGRLYVGRDGGGRVSILDSEGRTAGELPLPGSRVTDAAFGGATLTDLFVTVADTGTLYRIPTGRRCARLPWEADPALVITEPVDGAILNHNDGRAEAGGLRIPVKGRCRIPGPVRINGASVPVRDGRFETSLLLHDRETSLRAEAGRLEHRITVLWDRDSFRRYRVSTDDNIWFLRDIARHADTYRSIFDNAYLGFWREMHRKYGTKVHFNIYYETSGFNLSEMPDKFGPEWRRNADWIRLSFHARANDPDRPYLHASAEKIVEDYRLVVREIERFAGKELLSTVTTVHWCVAPREAARALRREGVRGMVAYFDVVNGLPDCSMYLPFADWRYMAEHDYRKDMREDLLLIRHDMVMNLFAVDKIVPYLEQIAGDPHRSEILELMIHEQYFYPDYVAYEPDYRTRVETAVRWASGHGYKPVLYDEGFLGAPERR
jgi:sugar lactone lactonase YvrE